VPVERGIRKCDELCKLHLWWLERVVGFADTCTQRDSQRGHLLPEYSIRVLQGVQLGHVFEPSAMETGRGTPDILYMFCFPLLRKFEGNGNLVGAFGILHFCVWPWPALKAENLHDPD
jgi:hypothetical protein